MKPVGEDQRVIANITTACFVPFLVDGAPLSGESVLQLDDSQSLGVGFHVYRMEPGTSSQPHEHTCDEQFVVLNGELVDHDGTAYRMGDMVLLRKGSQHSSHTQTGCTLAVFIAKAEKDL